MGVIGVRRKDETNAARGLPAPKDTELGNFRNRGLIPGTLISCGPDFGNHSFTVHPSPSNFALLFSSGTD